MAIFESRKAWRRSRSRPLRAGLAGLIAAAAGALGAGPAAAAVVHAATAGTSFGFTTFHPPESSAGAHTAEEPSIGYDSKTGATMYQSLYSTYRVNFNDATSPATASWTDVSAPLTSQQSLDPILFTDYATGRTFVSQLAGPCSLSEFSDDDGATWTPDEGCGPPSGIDHQTMGGGPFALLPASNPLYADAVYYCSQADVTAFCAMSADGGATFGPGVPIYTVNQCGGLHGHVRVSPDGTAIVPNQSCPPNQAAVVSTNNGATWTVHPLPDSVATSRSDPSVAADSASKLYFGYEGAVDDSSGAQVAGHAMISMSSDDGSTWSKSVDVGAPLGIQNVTFPEVIAGTPGRAAYAFLGSTTPGDPEQTTYKGLWYLYVAITDDGGNTWTVQNLTPGDPVERGCTYLAGSGDCPNPAKRNLYDFMDITHDSHGRVEIGYSKGCTGTCVTDQAQPCADAACDSGPTGSTDHLASIAREGCGISLIDTYAASLACPATGSHRARGAHAPPRASAHAGARRGGGGSAGTRSTARSRAAARARSRGRSRTHSDARAGRA